MKLVEEVGELAEVIRKDKKLGVDLEKSFLLKEKINKERKEYRK